MASINKAILVGNLGKDPEIRHLDNDLSVANFPIATTENYKDRNGDWQEKTEWHNIVAWRYLAEKAEKFLKKGKQVYVEGKITTRSWDDKEGNKRYITEIVANNIIMLGRKDDESSGGSNYVPPDVSDAPPESGSDNTSMEGDDLPF